MSSTVLTTPTVERPDHRPTSNLWATVKWILKPVASLRLTVVLLALSVVLVFFGTVAQVDDSINTVLDRVFYCWIAKVPSQVFIRFGQKFFNWSRETQFPSWFPVWIPFPGGWILGGLLMINLLSAHAVRFKMTWRRSGIWCIHLGLMLLLLGEFLSSQLKIETRMTIPEGQNSNFALSATKVELALIDCSDSSEDAVTVIPESRLRRPGRISDSNLPVDVEVVNFLPNSVLSNPKDDNPATTGVGLRMMAERRKETSGVNPSQRVEVPSAYVKFVDSTSGADLGTHLMSAWDQVPPQAVNANGKTYAVSLRRARRYLPFSLHLIKFRFDRFVGTSVPRNYSSDVKLMDPEHHQARELRISMNSPLRYRGETFYQSSFDEVTERATVLSVVQNRAWTIPYVSCTLVVLGLLIHFGMHLNGFLGRRAAR